MKCSICTPKGYDIDIQKIFRKLREGYTAQIFCDNCKVCLIARMNNKLYLTDKPKPFKTDFVLLNKYKKQQA